MKVTLKPKILHIVDSFEQGGTERQALQLVSRLRGSGRCVYLASLQNKGSLRAEAERLGTGEIPEYPLNSFYDRNFVMQLRRLILFLKEHEINVVHSHDFYTNIFGMAAAFIARVPARIASKRETEGFRNSMQKRAERGAFRLAHRVVANSEAVRNQLLTEGVPGDKILTIHNGLDSARVIAPAGLRRDDALANLDLPREAGRRFVTIVANLHHPVKDHPMFLRAAARVRAAVPNVAFVVAGEGNLLASLRTLAIQLGIERDVYFIGRCDNVANLLFASDVGVLSSKAEGFANAILEYMAAGLPVVATDVGGAREAIVEGETGFIVPSGDDEKMAEQVIRLLNEPARARAMGERGKLIVAKRFSSDYQLENTLALYDELLSMSKRVPSPVGHSVQERLRAETLK